MVSIGNLLIWRGRNNKYHILDASIPKSKDLNVNRLRVPLYLGTALNETSIDDLNLSTRASHCLKRSGFLSVGELAEGIDCRDDLLKCRGLGNNTADEIMEKLLEFQYHILPPDRKKLYCKRVLEVNGTTETPSN